jgi:glycosyltransferase involved in cell wall biosynthesis
LFLAVGNPRPEKGFEDLIQAVAILKHRHDHSNAFKVVVAGRLKDDPYCRMLMEKTKQEKVEDCMQFLGFRSDTSALYNGADVFVLSSRSEGLPMVILESMMAGLPVVSTRVGGIPQMMGDNGILVEPCNPEALADAMQLCLQNKDKRDAIAQNGRALVESGYSMDRMVDSYIRLYSDLGRKN